MLPAAARSPAGAYSAGTEYSLTETASGSALPEETTVTTGLVIWVTDWLPEFAPPGMYSPTVPETVTASPTATVGAEPVKTKMPSLVASLSSASGSWNQKPREP